MADKAFTMLGRGGAVIAGLATVPAFCMYTVDGGERAVIFNRFTGVADKVSGEGTHLMIPWVMSPYIYNIRVRPKMIQTTTGTKDLQTVQIHCRLLFKPNENTLPEMHKKLGPEYDERVLPSIGNEVLKAVIAQYNAEQLLTQRERVSKEVRDSIVSRCKAFNIELDDVSIVHLAYGREFAKAIEDKQVAEQEAEKQKFVVQMAEQDRQAMVIRSEGEAEAATLISDALKQFGTGIIEVRRIDAAKEIAEKLSNNSNIMYMPNGQNMLLNMNPGR